MAGSRDVYFLDLSLDQTSNNPDVTITVSLTEGSIMTGWFFVADIVAGVSHGTAMGTTWNVFVPANTLLMTYIGLVMDTTVSGTIETSVALAAPLQLYVALPQTGNSLLQTLPVGSTGPISFTWTAPTSPGAVEMTAEELNAYVASRIPQRNK